MNQATNKAKLNPKARAEAEAKEREDAKAYKQVLAEFEEEHGDGESTAISGGTQKEEAASSVVVPTGSNRHFAGRARTGKSGPGTLEPEPSFGFNQGRFGGQQQSGYNGPTQRAPSPRGSKVYASIIGKASNLPLDTDPASLEALFSGYPSLKVEKVEKVPPSGPSQKGRPSVVMLITFDKDAIPAEFTKAMLALSDKKYLGRGYYIHLDRYLGNNSTSNSEQRREESPPFGAKRKTPELSKGFAPPPDLGGAYRGRGGGFQPPQEEGRMVVTVERPSDIQTLKLIHQTIEGVIQGGQEFEAALMQHPQVIGDEKFVWLYDSKHPHSVYYRWQLHQMISSLPQPDIFRGEAEWEGPEKPLSDEYANHIEDLDPDYEEPGIDEDEDKLQRGFVESSSGMLNPADRTLFMWLLANLPPFNLMVEDIAPFTAFAVDHVNQGMDEIIDLLITNIIIPFNLTEAKANYRPAKLDGDEDRQKRSKASTNALRIVSDLALTTFKDRDLSHTWKCRQTIGERLIDRKVFDHLDKLPERLQLGKLSEGTYREEVQSILEVWGKETLFDKASMTLFDNAFNERKRIEKQERDQAARKKQPKKISMPKKVASKGSPAQDAMEVDNSDDVVMGNMDGANDEPTPPPQEVIESVEAETPKESVNAISEPKEDPPRKSEIKQAPAPVEIPGETAAARARRMRPKAEDMFASDEE
jgi:U2-associated protein SR140